jgi:hypothetical protein
LANRIQQGPRPPTEALGIARQIAEALEAPQSLRTANTAPKGRQSPLCIFGLSVSSRLLLHKHQAVKVHDL